jgi:methionine-rich copper-binding protein CopC
MRRFLFAVVAMAAMPAAALAHARLDNAVPRVGSNGPAPREVVLNFTEAVEPKFSSVQVVNAKGAAVQAGTAHLGASGTQLRVGLKALPPGTYTVIWRVLSVDTHRTNGTFSFTVGK